MKPMDELKQSMAEKMLEKKLKKQDQLELPMDEKFFENLHDRIMLSIEKTEVKPLSRWAKTWVFLETMAKPHSILLKKAMKLGVAAAALTSMCGLAQMSIAYFDKKLLNNNNQSLIIQEAQQSPTEWGDLVVSYQNENDFYADVLSQRNDLGTIVEIDRVLTQSL